MTTKRYKISEKAVEKLMKENLELKKSLRSQKEIVFDTICSHDNSKCICNLGMKNSQIQELTNIDPRQVRVQVQKLKAENRIKQLPLCSCGNTTPRYVKS